jgi:hypothetical protein
MSMGIVCGIVYILLNLSALPPSLTRFSGMLLYASIVALSSGLLFYLMARTGGAPLTRSAFTGREKHNG